MGSCDKTHSWVSQVQPNIRLEMALEKYNGTWKMCDWDTSNFDKYLKAIPVGFVVRTAAKNMGRTVHFKAYADGTGFTLKSVTKMRTMEAEVILDQEKENSSDDGRKVKATFFYKDD